jgi:hypothetical protein
MSKSLIQFAGVLFMLAALLAVSAQENTTALNNATLNNTTLNASAIEAPVIEANAAQNETAPAQNVTLPENATVATPPVSTAGIAPAISQPKVTQVGSPQKAVAAIGGGESAPSTLSIGGNALPKGAHEVGLPAKTIMDLSALPFFTNKI